MSRLAIFILFLTVTYCSTIKKREVDEGNEPVEGLEKSAENVGERDDRSSESGKKFEGSEKFETKREKREEERRERQDETNDESEFKGNEEPRKNQKGEIESDIEKKENEEEKSKEGGYIKNENFDSRNCGRESEKEQQEYTLYLVPIENEVIYPVDTYEVPIVYYL